MERLLGARAAAAQTPRQEPKVGRSAPCARGSGPEVQELLRIAMSFDGM